MAELKLTAVIDAKDQASSKIKAMESSIGSSLKVIGGLAAGAATAIGAFAAKSVADFSRVGDEVEKMSERTGLSAKAVSALRVAADASGTSIEAVETAVKKMQLGLSSAATFSGDLKNALQGVGLTADDFFASDLQTRFEMLGSAIGSIKDPSEKTRLAVEAFGKSGSELIPLMEQGNFSFDEWSKKAEQLGVSFDDLSAKRAADLNDALGEMKAAVQGLTLQVGGALAPAITNLIENGIVPLIPKIDALVTGGFSVLQTAIGFVSDKFAELYDWLKQTGIIDAFAEAFRRLWDVVQNQLWPALQSLFTALEPLMPFLKALAELVGVVLIAAFYGLIEAVTLLAQGLALIINTVTKMIKFLTEKYAPAISTATDLFTGFKNVIMETVQWLDNGISKLGDWINKAKSALNLGGLGSVIGKFTSVEARATGGPVSSGRPYLVGERGPEMFVPSGAGRIVPNMGGVTVNMTIGSVSSDMDVRRMTDMVADRLMRSLRNNQQLP